jgi:hypothetical protein
MNNNQINPDEIFFKIKTPLDVEVRTTIKLLAVFN